MRSWSSWIALGALVACSDAGTATDPPIEFNPQERGTPEAGVDAAAEAGCPCAPGPNQHCASCVVVCNDGFSDCNGQASDGCEKPVGDDPQNCGACGRSCAACGDATCTQGACAAKPIVTGQTGAYDVALDATRVYWSNRVDDGAIRRAPKGGGASENVTQVGSPSDIFVSGTYVYYTRPAVDGVARAPMPDIVGPFPPFVSGQDYPGGLVGDDTGVYWTRNKGLEGALVRCFGCNASALDLATSLPSAGKLALDESSIALLAGDALVTFDKTGQNQKTLAIGQQDVVALAIAGADVFVARASQITRFPKSGAPSSVFLEGIAPKSLRRLDGHLYFADGTALRRIDPNGQNAVTLARGLTAPGATTTDDACVYFTDGDRIARVTK